MLDRRIELWWEPTRAPPKSENKPGAVSVAPNLLRSCRLVFRAMRKIQHAEAELYQAFLSTDSADEPKIQTVADPFAFPLTLLSL